MHLSGCLSIEKIDSTKGYAETERSEPSIVVERVIKVPGILEKGLRVLIKAEVHTMMIAVLWPFHSWIFTTGGERHLSTQRLA